MHVQYIISYVDIIREFLLLLLLEGVSCLILYDQIHVQQSVLQSTLLVTHPGLQFLELFLASLHGQILSLIQAVLQVLDCDLQVLLHPLQVRAGVLADGIIKVSLHLLLHPQGIIPAPDLRVQGALHGVNHPLAVPLDLLHLLVLLSDLPIHLTLDLVQLQLHTQNLGFLMLQCSLDKQKQSGQLCSVYLDVGIKHK
uniref:Uncharacterized protein n=1 Tax=Hucho hucho TaxID=62062 RepID=A0A4W5JL96_9TELE